MQVGISGASPASCTTSAREPGSRPSCASRPHSPASEKWRPSSRTRSRTPARRRARGDSGDRAPLSCGEQGWADRHEIIARIDGLNNPLQDLPLFARTPKPTMASVEIAPLLRLTAEFLSKDPAFNGVDIAITGSGRPVQGDPELLRNVFQNPFINAAQAMQGQWRAEGRHRRDRRSGSGSARSGYGPAFRKRREPTSSARFLRPSRGARASVFPRRNACSRRKARRSPSTVRRATARS